MNAGSSETNLGGTMIRKGTRVELKPEHRSAAKDKSFLVTSCFVAAPTHFKGLSKRVFVVTGEQTGKEHRFGDKLVQRAK
jgi:hypothetical protein